VRGAPVRQIGGKYARKGHYRRPLRIGAAHPPTPRRTRAARGGAQIPHIVAPAHPGDGELVRRDAAELGCDGVPDAPAADDGELPRRGGDRELADAQDLQPG
jgi:hypothetical protein